MEKNKETPKEAVPLEHPLELTKHCPTCTDETVRAKMTNPTLEVHMACSIEHGHQACVHEEKKPIEADELFREMYAQKIIVLYEIKSNTDRFQQVMLTRDALQDINAILHKHGIKVPPPAPPGSFVVVTNPEHAVRLTNVPAYYPQQKIEEQLVRGPDWSRPL